MAHDSQPHCLELSAETYVAIDAGRAMIRNNGEKMVTVQSTGLNVFSKRAIEFPIEIEHTWMPRVERMRDTSTAATIGARPARRAW